MAVGELRTRSGVVVARPAATTAVDSAAEDQDLGQRQRVGVGDGEERRTAADGLEPACGASVKPQLRRPAASADDLDVAPQHPLRVARAQGFHRGFFRGKAPGEMNGRLPPAHAIRDFALGEDTMGEALAVARHGGGDARDVGGVKAEPDDVHVTQA